MAMNPEDHLAHVRTIRLPGDEGFQLVGHDPEGHLYVRESYWQMTSMDLELAPDGTVLAKLFYDESEDFDVPELTESRIFSKPGIRFFPEDITRLEITDFETNVTEAVDQEDRRRGRRPDLYLDDKSCRELLSHYRGGRPGWMKLYNNRSLFKDVLTAPAHLRNSLYLVSRYLHQPIRTTGTERKAPDPTTLKKKTRGEVLYGTFITSLPFYLRYFYYLEIGELDAEAKRYRTLHRFPAGVGEGEIHRPNRIVELKDLVLVEDRGNYDTRNRIHVFRRSI